MRGCFSPLLSHVPSLRSISPDSRWGLRRIQPTIFTVSFGQNSSFSSSKYSEGLGFRCELGFKEKLGDDFGLGKADTDDSSSLYTLEEDEESKKFAGSAKEGDLVRLEDDADMQKTALRGGGKQVMNRSRIVAKQVISIKSAQGLGFISQLWVDTACWAVSVVEVRPTLLAGESERFLLKNIARVGDVVLVEDEIVLENDLKMAGLETLVGYRVATPGGRSIGKVRGYSFNINSGSVDSLELDSFGISIIPSSLVSTYLIRVEDIIEVLSDIVVVEEAATSRMQRLTKGLLDTGQVAASIDDELGGHPGRRRLKRRNRSRGKRRGDDDDDDWGPPLDFL